MYHGSNAYTGESIISVIVRSVKRIGFFQYARLGDFPFISAD